MENCCSNLLPGRVPRQTAVECAMRSPAGEGQARHIAKITIRTMNRDRIIDKKAAANPPTASLYPIHGCRTLIFGRLTAGLRGQGCAIRRSTSCAARCLCRGQGFSRDYLDRTKRSIANAIRALQRVARRPRGVVEYRSGTGARARKHPLLEPNSPPNLGRRFPPSSNARFSTCATTRNGSKPRRSANSSICS